MMLILIGEIIVFKEGLGGVGCLLVAERLYLQVLQCGKGAFDAEMYHVLILFNYNQN
jgi:hypothetical protein